MAKEPRAGRVKTRLAREIGTVAATFFYRQAAGALIKRLAASGRWRTWLAVAPDTAGASAVWPPTAGQRGQGAGDLGRRMQRIMEWPGCGPLLIIGTDIPAIEPRHVQAAFRRLGNADAVFGPTPDGGYWLAGLRRSPRVLRPFAGVRWSSENALADTEANLADAHVVQADVLADVDTAADWRSVRAWSGRVVLPARA